MEVIMFGIGVVVGCVVMMIVHRSKSIGSLRVDTSDPDDGPYLFLELAKDVNAICRKKYVLLKVKVQNFISRK